MESRWRGHDPIRRRRRVVVTIVVVGWSLAAIAYVTAPPVVEDPDVYELEHSRKYLRQVEQIGGKAGIFVNDLNEWVAGQWEGKARARTIAVATVLVAGAYVLLARAARPS